MRTMRIGGDCHRLIDTAAGYLNEEAVGEAVKKSGIGREEFLSPRKYGLKTWDTAKPARPSNARYGDRAWKAVCLIPFDKLEFF